MERTFHVDYSDLDIPQEAEIVFSPIGGAEAMDYVEKKYGFSSLYAELVGSTWVVKETEDRSLAGSIFGKLEKMPRPSRMAELMK